MLFLFFGKALCCASLYFGLGSNAGVDKIEIQWPSGTVQQITEGITLNSTIEIVEP